MSEETTAALVCSLFREIHQNFIALEKQIVVTAKHLSDAHLCFLNFWLSMLKLSVANQHCLAQENLLHNNPVAKSPLQLPAAELIYSTAERLQSNTSDTTWTKGQSSTLDPEARGSNEVERMMKNEEERKKRLDKAAEAGYQQLLRQHILYGTVSTF